jgi:hypothetical protein
MHGGTGTMPVVLMLFFFLFLTVFMLIGAAGFHVSYVAAMFLVAGVIASVGLLRAGRMLDRD